MDALACILVIDYRPQTLNSPCLADSLKLFDFSLGPICSGMLRDLGEFFSMLRFPKNLNLYGVSWRPGSMRDSHHVSPKISQNSRGPNYNKFLGRKPNAVCVGTLGPTGSAMPLEAAGGVIWVYRDI